MQFSFKKFWWKGLAVVLIAYSIIGGFLIDVPLMPVLHETIRNLYFHVTMWFAMIALFSVALFNSIRYLSTFKIKYDIIAEEAVRVGILLGLLGLATGMIWAKYTWGAWWINDSKLNGSAITMLAYFAYLILRSSLDEENKRAKIASVYNIFAYFMLIVFILILPRMTDSLHPGNGGNPGFSGYDLTNNMKMVFYPAVLGWILMGTWLLNLRIRIAALKRNAFQNQI